jgi:hypothetical protein
MEQWRLESGLPLRARFPKAPLRMRRGLRSCPPQRVVGSPLMVTPGYPGYAKLHGTWVHPAFGVFEMVLAVALDTSYLRGLRIPSLHVPCGSLFLTEA